MNENSIGFFDSGIGGVSIWTEVNKILPNENTIYLADNKNAPYGGKSKETLLEISIKNTEFLIQKKCKLIVVACNTATTNAIDYLRANYSIPFVGTEPAVKPASIKSKTGYIGVLATKGTLASNLFEETSSKYGQDNNVINQHAEGVVELIEQGRIDSDEMKQLLEKYIRNLLTHPIDYLVLGCTHYFYLQHLLKKMLDPSIKIIGSGVGVAKQTERLLNQHQIINTAKNQATYLFYNNASDKALKHILSNEKSPYQINTIDF